MIVLNAVMFVIYLLAMNRAGGSTRESDCLLNRAPLSWVFWVGVVGLVVSVIDHDGDF
jgi:hypothetical protein